MTDDWAKARAELAEEIMRMGFTKEMRAIATERKCGLVVLAWEDANGTQMKFDGPASEELLLFVKQALSEAVRMTNPLDVETE